MHAVHSTLNLAGVLQLRADKICYMYTLVATRRGVDCRHRMWLSVECELTDGVLNVLLVVTIVDEVTHAIH